MRRASKKTFLTFAVALAAAQRSLLQAQTPVAPTFQGAVNDIRTIAIAAGTLVAGMVGLVGLGRTAYKLSQGDADSMTALIFAIVGIVLGFLANTFIICPGRFSRGAPPFNARLGNFTREPAMKETPIFRNIQHIPRVWGVTYVKLFATLGGGLLATTLAFALTPGATTVVKVLMIGLGVAATLLGYVVCFLMDNTDRLESDAASFLN